MAGELVDLSLFADAPIPPAPRINHHRNYFDEVAPYQLHTPLTWPGPDYTAYAMQAASNGQSDGKALPRLPKGWFCEARLNILREDPQSRRCVLQRMKRMRLDGLGTGSGGGNGNGSRRGSVDGNEHSALLTGHDRALPRRQATLQNRRNIAEEDQLKLPVSPRAENSESRRPAIPMMWLPDEQMWLMADESRYDIAPSATYFSPREDRSPRSARSEPTSRYADTEHSPVRSQFRTLMERRPEERRTLHLQEAVHGMSFHDYDAFYARPESPEGYQIERIDLEPTTPKPGDDFHTHHSIPSSSVYSMRSLATQTDNEHHLYGMHGLYSQYSKGAPLSRDSSKKSSAPIMLRSFSSPSDDPDPSPYDKTRQMSVPTTSSYLQDRFPPSSPTIDDRFGFLSDPKNYRISTVTTVSAMSECGSLSSTTVPSGWRPWMVSMDSDWRSH
ncbi:hypothetical protein MMC25_000777 [Agyrium rufum]|nr:hypothetical protein [Agyrium rufum]